MGGGCCHGRHDGVANDFVTGVTLGVVVASIIMM